MAAALIGRGATLLPKLGQMLRVGGPKGVDALVKGSLNIAGSLAPTAGRVGLYGAGAVGAGWGATKGLEAAGVDVSGEDGLLSNIGLDTKSRAAAGSFDRTKEGGKFEQNLFQKAMNLATGQSTADLKNSAQQQSNAAILDSETLDNTLTARLKSAGFTDQKIKEAILLGDQQSATDYKAKLQLLAGSVEQLEEAQRKGLNTSGMFDGNGQLKSASTLQGIISDLDPDSQKNINKDTRRLAEEARETEKRRYQSDQDWKKLQFATLQEQNNQAREDRVSTQRLQLQLGQLDRAERREVREMDNRRADRKDRQMMIMQMMKGLSQLGHSFAI